jgi:23S rRNA (uracil1939-C5)-methyltransferase
LPVEKHRKMPKIGQMSDLNPSSEGRTVRATLKIDDLGRRGEGIANGPGGHVFVPLALPGECIEADLNGDHGVLIDLQQASPHRSNPPCPYFGDCGGCSLQHLDSAFYSQWKRSLIVSLLTKQGLAPLVHPLGEGQDAGRRRVVLHVRRSSTGSALIGFMAANTHRLVPIDRCLVLVTELQAALPAAKELGDLFIVGTPAFDLQFTAVANGIDCDIRGIASNIDKHISQIAEIARRHGICRISVGGSPLLTLAVPFVEFDGIGVVPPPSAFLQATAAGEQALTDFVLTRLGASRRAVDLFCGIGTFTFPLARRLSVLAVDSDARALEALTLAHRNATGLKPIEAQRRNLFREPLTANELNAIDLVLFDPPRQGAEAQAREIAASRCRRIIAVSCDPVTFARDASILVAGGYTLVEVLPVDQFQWSAHLEIAALFTRGSKLRRTA